MIREVHNTVPGHGVPLTFLIITCNDYLVVWVHIVGAQMNISFYMLWADSSSPQNSYVEILAPTISECDYLEKRSLKW